jgi:hypothetical protein
MSSEIKIVPFPDEAIDFSSNRITISTPIKDIDDFDHTGEYVITSSSYCDGDHLAYNVFNHGLDRFWQSDFNGNPLYDKRKFAYKTPYTQNPYVKSTSGPSVYQSNGGGSISTTWSTPVKVGNSTNIVKGEWIQIQIPTTYPVYLSSYSILSPPPDGNICMFPQNFMVLGSMDGNTWSVIDQQIFTRSLNSNNGTPILFKVNAVDKACYFRLVITSLFQNNDIPRINHWSLTGTSAATTKHESFETMTFTPIGEAYTRPLGHHAQNSPTLSQVLGEKEAGTVTYSAYSSYERIGNPYSIRENFDDHGYSTQNTTSGQLQSLNAMNQDFVNMVVPVQQNKQILGNTIASYKALRSTLQTESMNTGDKYEWYGNALPYNVSMPATLEDARKKDNLSMVVTENNLYILGSITIASLLVFAVYLAKD